MEKDVLPFEKRTVYFYHFYFYGFTNPLIIQADNFEQAYEYLIEGLTARGEIDKVWWIDMKVTTPIYGITEQIEKGIKYIWVGFDNSETGWITKQAFDKLNIND